MSILENLEQFEFNNSAINRMRNDLRLEKLNKGLDPDKQDKAFGLYIIRRADAKIEDKKVEDRKIYVGMSQNVSRRWTREINIAFTEKDKHYELYLSKFIREYGQNRENVKELLEFVIIAEFNTFEEALKNKMNYIELFKTNIDKFGTNLTKGGEGILGYSHTDEHKKRMSELNKGENNKSAKLTDQEVIEIRTRYATENCTYKLLAAEYKVGTTTIKKIINNISWKNENLNLDKIKQAKINNEQKRREKFKSIIQIDVLKG